MSTSRRWTAALLGLQVQFAANGSSQGRTDATGQVDFAVSDVEYGLAGRSTTHHPPRRGFR